MAENSELSEREKRIAAELTIVQIAAERDRCIVELEQCKHTLSRLLPCVERMTSNFDKMQLTMAALVEKVAGPMPHDLADENPLAD